MSGPLEARFALIDQLLHDGIRYMFGNPGTVEQGLLDALGDRSEFQYILALHETVAVSIAEAYARATMTPAVVQLHAGVGLGNGIGMIYQAMRGSCPLVILAGEAGIKYDAMDSHMAADLVSMARPVTKWSTRVVDSASLLRVMRRALKVAATPPMGPVFVSIPQDILDGPTEEEISRTSFLDTRTAPTERTVESIVDMFRGAMRPMIIVGDGVAFSGAQSELVEVAELLGAEVYAANSTEVNIPTQHVQYKGPLGRMFGQQSSAITSQADAVLICGTYVFSEVFPALNGVFASHARIAHIDLDAGSIAKNFPVDIGVVSDPKTTLSKLAERLRLVLTDVDKSKAKARIDEMNNARVKEQQSSNLTATGLTMMQFAQRLRELTPKDTIIYDEGITNSPALTRYFRTQNPGTFYQTRSCSLGTGFPGAIGLKLANPVQQVIGFSGDGGAMYTIQALWTAARHNINAKFVVCNNRSYKILQSNLRHYWQDRSLPEHPYPASFDLRHPAIDFRMLARGHGVDAIRVENVEEIDGAIKSAFSVDEPYLIEVLLDD